VRKQEESTACGVRREEWHLWEIISRWLDPAAYYTQLRSDFEGKRFPGSDTAPRNP